LLIGSNPPLVLEVHFSHDTCLCMSKAL